MFVNNGMLLNINKRLGRIDDRLDRQEKNDKEFAKLGIRNKKDLQFLKNKAQCEMTLKLRQKFPDGYVTFSVFKGGKRNDFVWEDKHYQLTIPIERLVHYFTYDISYSHIRETWDIICTINPNSIELDSRKFPGAYNPTQVVKLTSKIAKDFEISVVDKILTKKSVTLFIKELLDRSGYTVNDQIQFIDNQSYQNFLRTCKHGIRLQVNQVDRYRMHPHLDFQKSEPLIDFTMTVDGYEKMTYCFAQDDICMESFFTGERIYSKKPVSVTVSFLKTTLFSILLSKFSIFFLKSFRKFQLEAYSEIRNEETSKLYRAIFDIHDIIKKFCSTYNHKFGQINIVIKKSNLLE